MKWYIFVTIKAIDGPLTVWYSPNVIKSIEHIKSLPQIKEEHRLIYLEIADNRPDAEQRFHQLNSLTNGKKLEVVKVQNPDLITLHPGINIEI